MKTLLLSALVTLLLVLGLQNHAAIAAPDVVVSIKPLHSLVAGVMGDAGTPGLLVPGNASPHVYQMRPSEAKMLNEADIVVWIGENMESFLERPIANLGSDAVELELHAIAGIRLLPSREGGLFEEDHHDEAHEDEHDDHGHDHAEFDMHVWLDPANAQRIVAVVADTLVDIDPANADVWRMNAEMMTNRINQLVLDLQEQLEPVHEQPYVVFHDGYGYFENAFDLHGIGALAVDPSRPVGAKRLAELREALEHRGVACVFSEPQFEPDLVNTLVEGTDVRIGVLDPIGSEVQSGPDAWFEIMENLGTSFSQCLGDG